MQTMASSNISTHKLVTIVNFRTERGQGRHIHVKGKREGRAMIFYRLLLQETPIHTISEVN